MNKVFFSFFILMTTFSFGQFNIDSLLTVWNDESLADTSRLNALDKIGRDLMDPEPDSAISYALIQQEFAEKKDLKKYIADALYIQGKAFDSKGELSLATDFLEGANKLYEDIGIKNGSATALYGTGQAKWTAGDYDTAKEYYRKSMAISEEIGNKDKVASCLVNSCRTC